MGECRFDLYASCLEHGREGTLCTHAAGELRWKLVEMGKEIVRISEERELWRRAQIREEEKLRNALKAEAREAVMREALVRIKGLIRQPMPKENWECLYEIEEAAQAALSSTAGRATLKEQP